jgi:hypothetical protein
MVCEYEDITIGWMRGTYIDGWTEFGVVFPWVFAFAVPFGIVNVFDLNGTWFGYVGREGGWNIREDKPLDVQVLLQIRELRIRGPENDEER